jgi:hypothetical protein
METGIAAPWSLADAFGSLCFISKNENGEAGVVRTNGYTIEKIATPNEVRILSALPDLFNTRAFTYQDAGHVFYVICPNTGPALVFDMVSNLLASLGRVGSGTKTYGPLKQWCHAFGHGLHLVGDRTTGTIYEMALHHGTDAGTPIRRVRTCPHVNQEQQWLFGSQVSLGVETGLSPGHVHAGRRLVSADRLTVVQQRRRAHVL